MRVLVSGSSGLIGGALCKRLVAAGYSVVRLRRGEGENNEENVYWNPQTGHLDARAISGCDAVVHLAGESIATGRWTNEKKRRIRQSRVDSTRLLATVLAELATRAGQRAAPDTTGVLPATGQSSTVPRVLLSASAVGIYGDRGDEVLDEDSPRGSGFLAEVCQQWEAATTPAAQAGLRVVCMRFAVVLARQAGALAKMLTPFRWGLGGRLGHGRQYISWITLEDAVGAILFLLQNDAVHGPVNVAAPQPVTNRQFTAALAEVLHRPALLPVPAMALKILLGQMAEELLLASARVVPKRLIEAGYRFATPELFPALSRVLSEPAA